MIKFSLALVTFSVLTSVASLSGAAETITGTIGPVGNHNFDNVCYASLDAAGSISTCGHGNQVRWDCGTEWGKRWYANFLIAHVSGLSVSVHIKDNECSPQGSPTFDYGTVM